MNETTDETKTTRPVPEVKEEAKPPRGFARLDPEKVRELARRGGISAHRSGVAYEWNSDAARAAGKKGAAALRKKPGSGDAA